MNPSVTFRLCVMMFIQFFIWGAWYVTAPLFLGKLGFTGGDFGWTYSVGPIAGMISPFFVGMVADRFFSTERVLGLMHLAGSAAMGVSITMMRSASPSPDTINALFFLHMLCYFPTLALVNSLAMAHITNTEKQFPLIRVFGTFGWIAAGVVLSYVKWDASINMFYLAAGAAAVMGLYCFTLPHTPPPLKGKRVAAGELLGLGALVMLKRPSFAVFMVSSFLVCIPLAFYYQMAAKFIAQAGIEDPAFKMTFGQMSEVFFMIAMPLFFVRLGVKWMLFVGMLAWVTRYTLFALGAPEGVAWMLLTGVVLHGICYDFFFVTGQIYTDKSAPPGIRAQAQGMLVLFTLGLGMFIGAKVAGYVEERYTPPQAVALREEAGKTGDRIKEMEAELGGVDEALAAPIREKLDLLAKDQEDKALKADQMVDWKSLWAVPAIGAGVVMVLFALIFKDDTQPVVSDGEVARAAAVEEQP